MMPTIKSWSELLAVDINFSQRLWIAERPGMLRNIAILFAHSGDSWLIGAALALVLAFGSIDWRWRSVWMLAAILVTALTVFAIKFTVRRSRPEGDWGQIYRRTDPHSFPSGHAARAALLVVMAFILGPPWFGWILLVWAPFVMLARVAMGLHYFSDIFAGALLGLAIGLVFWWIIPQISALL
jgi:undecaprenyl-diphosphatase